MQDREQPAYRDPNQPLDSRIDDLLARMTVDEKIAQMGGMWSSALLRDGTLDESIARQLMPHGIGQVTRIGGSTALTPTQSAAFMNAIQRFLVEETRLGIPTMVHEESLAGYMARDATCFPQAIGLAATWQPDLVEAMSSAIREQLLAIGARQGLAPVLDVARDPRWGRTEETYGEDPYLISALGVAYVRGLQNHDLREGVAATAKHFIGHGFPEGGLNWAPVRLPPRELREVYALPFEAVIREVGIATVMNAYHEMDGVPCGASRELLVDLLRDELGFDGLLVADYFTVDNLLTYHRVAKDKAEAARLALQAGIDIELPALDCFGEPLHAAVAAGEIDMALIDAAVHNVLRLKFQLGLFEQPYVDTGRVAAVFARQEPHDLAREIATQSIVLLKNADDLLPLSPALKTIAVIGPAADSARLLQGDYHYPAHLELMFGDNIDGAPMPTPDMPRIHELPFVPMVTALAGIKASVSAATKVLHAQGCDVRGSATDGFAAAVAAAQAAEVAVVVVGGRSGLTPASTSGEALDRAELGLPGVQQQLVEAVVATGTPVVVVLVNGRPLALPWIAAHVPAVLEAWLPGEAGGTAIADVLFGAVNPSGRLPISLPRQSGQLPVYYGHKPSGGRSHWYGAYIDSPTTPLYPFGHGLSYAHFKYDNLRITPEQIDAAGTVTISLDVQNCGPRAGAEVVQLYVHDPVASVTRPVKALKGFTRVMLEPGETKRVTFRLPASLLAFFGLDMTLAVEPGEVRVLLGSSSADIRLEGAFTITGATTPIVREQRVFFSEVTVG